MLAAAADTTLDINAKDALEPPRPVHRRVVVETPVNLSGEQKELLRKFEESLKADGRRHAPREEGCFEGVKRFFTRAEG